MTGLTYLDFDLWIGRATEGYVVKGRDSHGREATVDARMPFRESQIEDFWRRIGRRRPEAHRHAAAPEAGDPRREPDLVPRAEAAKSYGGSLFEALFYGELLNCLRRSLEEADREQAGLRIRLRLADVPELSNLPWEYLYDGSSDRFFALSVRTPVVRYLELPDRLQPLAVQPPLKMLVMVASPSDYGALDVEQEWRRLNQALGDLKARGLIELQRLEGATLAVLQRLLRRGRAHIFHFIGHGDFDQNSQEGVLILEDEQGRGRPVSGEELGIVLHDQCPRLVVLNACEGARTSRLNPFAGVGQTLIRQGVPAVVAMQSEILDDFALILAQELYGALADGYPVDACLTEARKVLAGQRRVAWGAPVLYLRAPDGRILDLEEPGAGDPAGAVAGGAVTPGPPIPPPAIEAPAASERHGAGGGRALTAWAAAAALVLSVVLVLWYGPWRIVPDEAVPILKPPPEVIAPKPTESEASEPPAREGDRIADVEPAAQDDGDGLPPQAPGSAAEEVSPSRSFGIEPERLSEAPPPAGNVALGSKQPASPAPRRIPAPASFWPRPDRRNAVHRNPQDGLYYAWIPAGSFKFGCSPGDDLCEDDEQPAAQRKIERGFWLGRTEVTVGAYKRFRDHPSKLPPAPSFNPGWQDEVQPMVNVSRADAASFCRWAAERLPTEIEWEYAARAGERRAWPPDVAERAWFAGHSDGRVHAVSQKQPNAFGLFDMLGNAGEWVAPDPDQPADSGIVRGGSWLHDQRYLRFSFRLPEDPGERNEMYGFRCLAEASP